MGWLESSDKVSNSDSQHPKYQASAALNKGDHWNSLCSFLLLGFWPFLSVLRTPIGGKEVTLMCIGKPLQIFWKKKAVVLHLIIALSKNAVATTKWFLACRNLAATSAGDRASLHLNKRVSPQSDVRKSRVGVHSLFGIKKCTLLQIVSLGWVHEGECWSVFHGQQWIDVCYWLWRKQPAEVSCGTDFLFSTLVAVRRSLWCLASSISEFTNWPGVKNSDWRADWNLSVLT